jgi:hypothetical protein
MLQCPLMVRIQLLYKEEADLQRSRRHMSSRIRSSCVAMMRGRSLRGLGPKRPVHW